MEDIGIDIGTAQTTIWRNNEIVLQEPTAVMLDTKTRNLLAVGKEAAGVEGVTPATAVVIRPVKRGETNGAEGLDALYKMQTAFFGKLDLKPGNFTAYLSIKDGIGEVQEADCVKALMWAGAARVAKVDASIATAIGNGLRIGNKQACMILTIGAGVTRLTVFSMEKMVVQRESLVTGDIINEAIVKDLQERRRVQISAKDAEALKILLGGIWQEGEEPTKTLTVYGRDCDEGLPTALEVDALEIGKVIKLSCNAIIRMVGESVEEIPPDLREDIYKYGLLLDGGMSLLPGVAAYFSRCLGLRVVPAKNPRLSAAMGLGAIIRSGNRFQR